MKVNLVFVPPDGGEMDYQLEMDMPAIPNSGDYISLTREGTSGTEDFIIKRAWWNLEVDKNGDNGKTVGVNIECEFAIAPYSSENHRSSCNTYKFKKGKELKFDISMY